MMKRYFKYILPALFLLGFVACERDDDEPIKSVKSISRLYVSTSDYSGGASVNIPNLWVVDPVDSSSFGESANIQSNISAAMGGKTIHFSPFSEGLLFQAGMNRPGLMDTAVNVLTVNKNGGVSSKGRLLNRKYDNIRGLYYTVVNSGNLSEEFLLALNKSDTLSYGSLFAFNRPRNVGSGQTKPRFEMKLDYTPWGLKIEGNDVYAVKTGDNGGLVVYKDFTRNLIDKKDSILNIKESYVLTITGANNLAGIAYHKAKDELYLTDYSGDGSDASGRILIFENFSTLNTTQNITPTRIITGVNTKLKQPMDIAVDTREVGKYIYIADAGAKRVFRFLLTDYGNVAPNGELNIQNRTPQSLSLDAR